MTRKGGDPNRVFLVFFISNTIEMKRLKEIKIILISNMAITLRPSVINFFNDHYSWPQMKKLLLTFKWAPFLRILEIRVELLKETMARNFTYSCTGQPTQREPVK